MKISNTIGFILDQHNFHCAAIVFGYVTPKTYSRLVKSGLLSGDSRAGFLITEKGKQVLANWNVESDFLTNSS